MSATVSRPRFYVNIIEWLIETSYLTDGDFVQGESNIWHHSIQTDFYRTLPVSTKVWMPSYYGTGGGGLHSSRYFPIAGGIPNLPAFSDKSFVAILGHNIKSAAVADGVSAYYDMIGWSNIININNPTEYDGFSLSRFSLEGDTTANFVPNPPGAEIGSLVIGQFYEMPSAANLSLSLSWEHGKAKELTSYNGSSYSNTMFTPAMWNDHGAWELYKRQPTGDLNNAQQLRHKLAPKARRVWQLSFSYMSQSDLWGPNQLIGTDFIPTTDEIDEYGDDLHSTQSNNFNSNLLTDDNFFSMWNKTLGGSLPFIFQANKDDDSPDQFAIAKFRDNNFKATQVAPSLYNISVTIEEVF